MKVLSLQDYEKALRERGLLVSSNLPEEKVPVRYVTYDSRDLGEQTLFICKGASFREVYLQDVIQKGIQGYVSERAYEGVNPEVPSLIVTDIRKAMPVIAGLFYDFPWKNLHLVGLTGTKGKSTTAYYIKYILDSWMTELGKPSTGILSSIDNYDGVIFEESHLTTPENLILQRHFRNAVDSGIEYMEMEVSSQGLKYDRVAGVQFEVGVFMNISEDHISEIEHPTMEDYFRSKLKIFSLAKHAVVNLDSDRADEVLEAAKQSEDILTFSRTNPAADVFAYHIRKEDGQIRFSVRTKTFDAPFSLTMPGFFNVENALAAIATGVLLDVPLRHIQKGLHEARSSGRMEVYTSRDGKIIGIVDYAHNKLSFEKLMESTKQEYPEHKIVAIFGCPGGKALLRRKDLPEVAVQYASMIYLVAEDPGAEPAQKISEEIAEVIRPAGVPYKIIEDRGEAIRDAIVTAKEPSVLLITGKGNETRQKIGTEYIPCASDVEFTKKYLAEYDGLL